MEREREREKKKKERSFLVWPRSQVKSPQLRTQSCLMLLYVHRDHEDYNLGRGAQDGHLDSHTAPGLCPVHVQCCLTSTKTVRTIRDGAQDGFLDFHTALTLLPSLVLLCIHRNRNDYKGRVCPGRPPRLSHNS